MASNLTAENMLYSWANYCNQKTATQSAYLCGKNGKSQPFCYHHLCIKRCK